MKQNCSTFDPHCLFSETKNSLSKNSGTKNDRVSKAEQNEIDKI